ncbi:MAG TPA: SDR family NAD(P)-dependent oxidoreductase [Acidimicrobiales bacterium]|nr:SDR family NAD(P)-dependent oxidoreductase [Acidimicrobiales bacterium]
MELTGKTAVVTGAASGIGLATARRFADAGLNVVLGDLEEGPLDDAVASLKAEGGRVLGLRADVTVEQDVVGLRDAALAEFGGVHLVFNNAGVGSGPAIGTPKAVWDWVMAVNVGGVVNGINTFVPYFIEQDEGHVLSTASLAGLGGVPYTGAYCASKFAVVGLSESLFQELLILGSNVHVSVLCPGFVRTRIHESMRNLPEELSEYRDNPAVTSMQLISSAVVNAGIDPDDVGRAVVEAVREDRFWILTHPRSAIGATKLRLEWMRGGPPMIVDLDAATRP